jgi:hypothetical protein
VLVGSHALDSATHTSGFLTNNYVPFISNTGAIMQNSPIVLDATHTMVGIGIVPTKSLVLNQASASDGFQLTGMSINGTNTGTGFLQALGVNLLGNKQCWFGDPDYAGLSTGSFIRYFIYNGIPTLDAVRGDGLAYTALNIGVVSSAVSVNFVGSLSMQGYGANNCWFANNIWYSPTGWKYILAGFANQFYFNNGVLNYITCASGAAGAAATPATVFSIANNGQLTAAYYSTAGILHNSAAGLISSGLVVNADCGAMGTEHDIPFFGATGFTSSPLKVDATHALVGLGGVPAYLFDIQKVSANYGDVLQRIFAYGNNEQSPYLAFQKSRGASVGTLTETVNNDYLGIITAAGVNSSSAAANGACIYFRQTGAAGPTYLGGNILFLCGTNAAAVAEVARITATGVGIGGTPTSTLHSFGSFAAKSPTTVSGSTYAVLTTDYSLLCTYTANNTTLTLPAAASFVGRILWVKIQSASGYFIYSDANNVVPFAGGAAQNVILYGTTGPIWAKLQSDGSNWIMIARGS